MNKKNHITTAYKTTCFFCGCKKYVEIKTTLNHYPLFFNTVEMKQTYCPKCKIGGINIFQLFDDPEQKHSKSTIYNTCFTVEHLFKKKESTFNEKNNKQ